MFTNIKSLFMVLMLAATAQYATAESFNQEDMAFAFGDSAVATSDFGQMDLLSDQEMVATEGELFPVVYGAVFAARFAYTGYRVWRATRSGAQIYSRGLHKAHHNFGTRANPSWRYHYQWTTSKGSFRVPYGNHYLYKSRPDLGYRSTWFRR